MGVWIETPSPQTTTKHQWSHPSWVCGLKHHKIRIKTSSFQSHPSWVCGLKLTKKRITLSNLVSHPSWVCGLKPEQFANFKANNESHPSWVCGLKPFSVFWLIIRYGHTLRGCVDWNWAAKALRRAIIRHTLRGCVDWNTGLVNMSREKVCHTLRGCVDWNMIEKNEKIAKIVTPFVGVWIETETAHTQKCWKKESHPSWVCGLKQFIFSVKSRNCSHTLRGCVDWN